MWFLSKSKTKKIKLNYFIVCRLLPTMNQFRITLTFNTYIHSCNEHWGDEHCGEESYGDDYYWESKDKKSKDRKKAFEWTDRYYKSNNLEDYVKTFSAMGFVECMFGEAEVISAEWDSTQFAMHIVVKTDQDAEDLQGELEMNSLEDGEYEACGESGWVLFTRGPNGEVYDGGEGSEDVWEYALTDYRRNPIAIVPLLIESTQN